jgi:hypothetical protein
VTNKISVVTLATSGASARLQSSLQLRPHRLRQRHEEGETLEGVLSGSTEVEHSPPHPKVEGSSPKTKNSLT